MLTYLKAGLQVRTYSDYLRTTQEAEKEDSIELPEAPEPKLLMVPLSQGLLGFFPQRKLKGNQPLLKKVCGVPWHI